jgi:AcrR family transcriptional regulator
MQIEYEYLFALPIRVGYTAFVKKKIPFLPRKNPRQQRSAQMVDDILKGAIRVLKQQGGRHFTTIRVAEETGISVGSLYQYFPNKESILFQVQYREWQETSALVLAMLADQCYSAPQRLRRTALAFFESEWEEASLRKALLETGIQVHDSSEFHQISATVDARMRDFIAELAPKISPIRRRFLAAFVFTVMGSLAEEVTTRPNSKAHARQWASACADMMLAFLAKESG